MNRPALSRRTLEQNSQFLSRFIESELSGVQKKYIIMYFMQRKTVRQIAAETGVCPSTVSRTIKRGTSKLYKAVETARRLCG